MQQGCLIPNSCGHGPQYEYDTFICGSFSMDPPNDLSELGLIRTDATTDVCPSHEDFADGV